MIIGPINNAMQLERVASLVEDAKRAGAKVHAGGERLLLLGVDGLGLEAHVDAR